MAKVKVKIEGVDQVTERFQKFLKNAIKDETSLKAIAELAADQIKKRTQAQQTDYKQPELKGATIEARKLLIEVNGSSGFAKPARSNLTLTGQLLESIRNKIDSARSVITFYLEDARYEIFPISPAERKQKYNTIIDKDFNATNRNRKDQKDKDRIAGIFLASKKPKKKTNSEIKADLESRGRRFFFISDKLMARLQSKLKAEIRRQLQNYRKIKRSLK